MQPSPLPLLPLLVLLLLLLQHFSRLQISLVWYQLRGGTDS
jgi:hypothetical protein